MGKIEVKLFGSPAVVLSDDASRPIPLSIQPLLAYLVVEPDVRRHRDRAIDALWPDVEPNKSRHRLNTAVWRLRRVLDRSGSSVVDCGRSGRIGLSDDVVVDARQLVDLLEIGSTSDRTTGDDWRGFVELEDREFVSGCYHDWVIATRLRIAHAVSQMLQQQVRILCDEREPERALICARVLVRREPYREEFHRSVIRLATELGRFDEAEQDYERCVQVLRSELGVDPMAETVLAAAEARRLRLGRRPNCDPDASVVRLLDDALRSCRTAVEAIECATRMLEHD